MTIFIVGVSCVGKTAVGKELSELLDYHFFDLDDEIENFFSTPIEKLQEKFLGMDSFRKEASKALVSILRLEGADEAVIALPPSGLTRHYCKVIKESGGLTIFLNDKPENILERITFYDKDSKPIQKRLTEKEKKYYLNDIRKDLTYFKRSYEKSDLIVDISGLDIHQAALKVKEHIENYWNVDNAK